MKSHVRQLAFEMNHAYKQLNMIVLVLACCPALTGILIDGLQCRTGHGSMHLLACPISRSHTLFRQLRRQDAT